MFGDSLRDLLRKEAPTEALQSNLLIDIRIPQDKFLKEFYYPDFRCLRYLWYREQNKPLLFSKSAFDLYIRILGLLKYIGCDERSSIIRYNIYNKGDFRLVVESSLHKEELYRLLNANSLYPVVVYWVEDLKCEKVLREVAVPPLVKPTSLVSKSTIGVTLEYCEYCCYRLFC